eukprot:4334906-Pyramimonas_sp.AAC.1
MDRDDAARRDRREREAPRDLVSRDKAALCRDQLVICELASCEYLARQLQLVVGRAFEERARRNQPVPKAKAQAKELGAADFGSEVGHFLGTGETKGNL